MGETALTSLRQPGWFKKRQKSLQSSTEIDMKRRSSGINDISSGGLRKSRKTG
jgi:hypothetical protein